MIDPYIFIINANQVHFFIIFLEFGCFFWELHYDCNFEFNIFFVQLIDFLHDDLILIVTSNLDIFFVKYSLICKMTSFAFILVGNNRDNP